MMWKTPRTFGGMETTSRSHGAVWTMQLGKTTETKFSHRPRRRKVTTAGRRTWYKTRTLMLSPRKQKAKVLEAMARL